MKTYSLVSDQTDELLATLSEEQFNQYLAAPDMLKCLMKVVENEFDITKWPLLQDTIRATIAAAKGEQN